MSISEYQTLGSVVVITKGKKHVISERPSINAKRVIGIDDLRNDNFIRYTEDSSGTEAKPEDVLIAWDGANAGTVGFGKAGFIGSTIARLRIKTNIRLFTPFLGLLLKSKFYYLRQTSTGATIPHLSRVALESIPLPKVNCDDQIRIVYLLSKVERLIDQRKQDIQHLDDLLKSVFLEMFGDPVRNEMGWDKIPFSQMLNNIESGKSPKCESRKATENEWAVLRLGSVTSCFYKQEENKALLPDIYPDIRWEVKQGDLLFSRKNTYELVAACAYVFETRSKLLLPDLIFRLVFKNIAEVQPLFIWGLLTSESQRRQIQYLAAGTSGSMPNISKTNLKQALLIKPPIGLQNQFAAVVEKVVEIKSCYQESLENLEQLYDGLSHSAFKGDLDLSRINLPADMQKLLEKTQLKIERRTINNTLDKIAITIFPLEKITERMKWLNPLVNNPAFQAAQRIHDLTSLSPISQYVNSSQFTGLGETARQLAAFRANLPTINIDQLNTWSNISSNIAALTGSYPSVLDAAKQFEYFTEQDWTKLGVEWAFNNYVEELDDEPFTMEKCATFVEEELHNEEAEESFKLLREHYEHIKEQLFKALRNGNLVQNYNDQENRVCVFRNRTAEV